MFLDKLFDKYTIQARLYPAFLLFFPLLIVLLIFNPDFAKSEWKNILISLAISCGVFSLLASLSRSAGKILEKKLIKKWGGWPTTIWLRHSDNNLSLPTKERYHKFLADNIQGLAMPSVKEEQNDPSKADLIYQSAIDWLREQRRDNKKYPLIEKELFEYGFRRNLAGLRWTGFCLYSLTFIIIVTTLWFEYLYTQNVNNTQTFMINLWNTVLTDPYKVLTGLIMLFAAFFSFKLNEDWVKEAADQYAKVLLNSIDNA